MAPRAYPRRVAAAFLAIAVIGAAAAEPAVARKRVQRVYIAIGDSVTVNTLSPGGSFAQRFYKYLRRKSHGGATKLVVLPSFTSGGILRPGDALDQALRLIGGKSDVMAVTLTTGGNDALGGACWAGPACPFPTNLDTILRRLGKALKKDPGHERRELLAYYNPRVGPPDEAAGDLALLGTDMRVDCRGTGALVGLNDDVACIGWRDSWIVVDAWPRFKSGGQSLLFPGDVHANAAGNAALVSLFANACSLPAAGPGVPDPDGFLAARPAGGGRGCVAVH